MATKIDYRFIFDSSFFEERIKNDYKLQAKLTYITSKTQGNKKRQNLISEKSRDIILQTNPKISLEVVRYFLNKADVIPEIEMEDDEVTRTLKYAAYYTYSYPNKVMVFTSEARIISYKQNPHYQNIKNISFISGDAALFFIDYWFDKCREEIEDTR